MTDRVTGLSEHTAPEGPCRACGSPAHLAYTAAHDTPPTGVFCSVRCWGDYQDREAVIAGRLPDTAQQATEDTWDAVAAQLPPQGPPGITCRAGPCGDGLLLFRDATGALIGVLRHTPNTRGGPGALSVHRDPACRGQGVGRALVSEAARRWGIDLKAQRFTADGLAMARRALPPWHNRPSGGR